MQHNFTSLILPTLLTLSTWGCGETETSDNTITINFGVEAGGSAIDCGSSFTAGTGDGTLGISDLKMYISEVELLNAAGEASPMALTPDGLWQTGTLALLDFEDRSGGCTNGTEATNTQIIGTAPEGVYTGLRFTLGVPFELNHADPAQATGPLTFTAMHWGWQGGYKFIRVDVTEESGSFRFHLGSTGCEGTIGAITECSRPNRPRIELTDVDLNTQSIVLNLDQLFSDSDLTANADGTTMGCMGSETDPDCVGPFEELGLDLASGEVSSAAAAFMVK